MDTGPRLGWYGYDYNYYEYSTDYYSTAVRHHDFTGYSQYYDYLSSPEFYNSYEYYETGYYSYVSTSYQEYAGDNYGYSICGYSYPDYAYYTYSQWDGTRLRIYALDAAGYYSYVECTSRRAASIHSGYYYHSGRAS
jgi:hypothetical protein